MTRTHVRGLRPALASLGLLAAMKASAFGVFVHLQGDAGDREAYFAATSAADRTSKDALLGPYSVKEIMLTAVYENAAKPEWVTLNLQFECANAWKPMEGKQAPAAKASAPVKFRLGPNGYQVRRADLKSQPVPESDWQTTTAPLLTKVSRIACQDAEFAAAIRASLRGSSDGLDEQAFGERVQKLGLPADLMLLGYSNPNEQADFCWNFLWGRARRPDPSGLWSRAPTDAERAAAAERMQKLHDESAPLIAAARQSLETSLRKEQAEREFQSRALAYRKGRKLNKIETHMIAVWVGRKEEEVVAKIGVPRIAALPDVRTLSFTKGYERSSVVVNTLTGAAWEEGVYSQCYMDFFVIPDAHDAWRVADVRVALDTSNYDKTPCYDLAKLPD
jgi:hypothetical protein